MCEVDGKNKESREGVVSVGVKGHVCGVAAVVSEGEGVELEGVELEGNGAAFSYFVIIVDT